MDDFAQSREADDLFADDIEPIDDVSPTTIHQPATKTVTQNNHPSHHKSSNTPRFPSPYQHIPQEGLTDTIAPTESAHDIAVVAGRSNSATSAHTSVMFEQGSAVEYEKDVRQGSIDEGVKSESITQQPQRNQSQEQESNQPQSQEPQPQENRVQSVRGDRSKTGPPKPTKKTEAQLTEMMSEMRLKNAKKAEAHERAAADQAIYLQRAQQEAQKRTEERKAIRHQDMERSKNRERKIRAQGGREWDLEKTEDDIVDRTRGVSSQYSRGAHGGVRSSRGGLASSAFSDDRDRSGIWEEPSRNTHAANDDNDMRNHMYESGGRGRGRGQRGDRSRGGRGGGGRGNEVHRKPNTLVPSDNDFPALPGSSSKPIKGLSASTWADEMATPVSEDKASTAT